MTDMKRVTISFTDDIDIAIAQLRNRDDFKKVSYAEIVRYLVKRGIEATEISQDSA